MIIYLTSKQIDKSHYFSVIYPFLHIAHSPEDMVKIGDIPSSVIKGLAIQRMIKGIYKTIKVFIDSLGIKYLVIVHQIKIYSKMVLYLNLGAYTTLEIVHCLPDIWSRSGTNKNENKTDLLMSSHVIFNGLKVNDNPRPKRLQTLGNYSNLYCVLTL